MQMSDTHMLYCVYLCFVLASSTLERVCLQICNTDEPTQVADVDLVRIRGCEETLMKELCSTMSYLTVSFHFTET